MKEVVRIMVEKWCKLRMGSCRVDTERLEKQVEIAERIVEADGLIVLRGPTGSGKTELWSAPFFAQWKRREWFAPRMYVVEPMHALLSQMKERMSAYAEALGVGIKVGEDHGEAPSDVYLYTAVVTLTTIDALIYGYLAQRVLKWRRLGVEEGYYTMPSGLLSSAYIVFDEAHLVQDEFYLGPRVLGTTICDLVGAGAKVVLSTATLPSAYLKYFPCFKEENLIDLGGSKRNVEIQVRDEVLTYEVLNREIDCDKRNLVIVNTVEKARMIYKNAKCGRKAVVHSLLRRGERRQALTLIKDGGLLIGTQALEVGLDLTLDVLYTELSPVDSLVQRLGRVGRYGQGEAVVFRADDPAPYLEELVRETERVVKAGYSNLNEWEFVKKAVDKVYNETTVGEMANRGERMYAQALDYLSELSLFSYPPRKEVMIRPSHYSIVYVVEGKPREMVEKDELLDGMIKFSYKDYENSRLKALLDKIGHIYIIDKESGKFITLKLVEERAKFQDGIVLFLDDLRNADLYDEAGVAVEKLSVEKTNVSGKKGRRSKRGRR